MISHKFLFLLPHLAYFQMYPLSPLSLSLGMASERFEDSLKILCTLPHMEGPMKITLISSYQEAVESGEEVNQTSLSRRFSPDPYLYPRFSGEGDFVGDNGEDTPERRRERMVACLSYLDCQMDHVMRALNPYSGKVNLLPRVDRTIYHEAQFCVLWTKFIHFYGVKDISRWVSLDHFVTFRRSIILLRSANITPIPQDMS